MTQPFPLDLARRIPPYLIHATRKQWTLPTYTFEDMYYCDHNDKPLELSIEFHKAKYRDVKPELLEERHVSQYPLNVSLKRISPNAAIALRDVYYEYVGDPSPPRPSPPRPLKSALPSSSLASSSTTPNPHINAIFKDIKKRKITLSDAPTSHGKKPKRSDKSKAIDYDPEIDRDSSSESEVEFEKYDQTTKQSQPYNARDFQKLLGLNTAINHTRDSDEESNYEDPQYLNSNAQDSVAMMKRLCKTD